jgi:hypothetical protein
MHNMQNMHRWSKFFKAFMPLMPLVLLFYLNAGVYHLELDTATGGCKQAKRDKTRRVLSHLLQATTPMAKMAKK